MRSSMAWRTVPGLGAAACDAGDGATVVDMSAISAPDLPPLPTPPAWEELEASARVVSVRMNVRFRGVEHREALLLDGPAGWGEFSPFLEYDDAEAAAWLACGVEAAWQGHPAPLRQAVPVNATVPAVAAGRVAEVLARYDGPGTVKVKVAERGQALADDVARVAAVRRELPGARLRVDANQGWDHAEALAALEALAPFELEYAEQPVPGIEGLARLREELHRRGLPVALAADEAVRKAEDPLAVARSGAADLIVVKAQPLGGARRAAAIVEAAGLPAVVSSALDTSVGLRVGVGLAAALPELPYACGLATGSLLAEDVADPPYRAVNGELSLREVAADPGLVEEHRAPREREEWWLARLRRSYERLAAVSA